MPPTTSSRPLSGPVRIKRRNAVRISYDPDWPTSTASCWPIRRTSDCRSEEELGQAAAHPGEDLRDARVTRYRVRDAFETVVRAELRLQSARAASAAPGA